MEGLVELNEDQKKLIKDSRGVLIFCFGDGDGATPTVASCYMGMKASEFYIAGRLALNEWERVRRERERPRDAFCART